MPVHRDEVGGVVVIGDVRFKSDIDFLIQNATFFHDIANHFWSLFFFLLLTKDDTCYRQNLTSHGPYDKI